MPRFMMLPPQMAILLLVAVLATLRLADGATGVTTRYWDGCKPSCSWPGKAATSASEPYVRACSANNLVLADAYKNVQSGCTTGTAYACAKYAPWAVNSTFAYGFAAVKLAGQTEASWCCACYRLDFTSGSVKGKTMIVQAINTGGDLGSNHFDLHIPGGGMGTFSGLLKQYPSTPAANWGRQFGGVSSLTACNGLPAVLQAGCRFRFLWGGGTNDNTFNNPTVNWQRVACPAVLWQMTDCKRLA